MLLITGANGNIGSELARALDGSGAEFTALVRDPARAAALPERARIAVGDLGDPATLAPAFDGVEGLFLLTPGIGTGFAANALAAAAVAGVERVVFVSSDNVLGDPMPAMGRWHHEREEMVRATGIPFTILRPSGFMSNALDWTATIREGGFVLDPAGPGRYAPIDPADIAAVAALALSEDGHLGREYVLTGGETLTVAEQAGILAAALGVEIEVREVASAAEAVRSRFPAGAPPELEAALLEGFELIRADTVGRRSDAVEHLLGRAPGTFAAWCRRHRGAFAAPALT
ncbi:MAG TPA: NAD(P)H-binding protein [Solirubrobacterales bacterium]|jgi:uncharacterized protein YbjT (DUF2867 family)